MYKVNDLYNMAFHMASRIHGEDRDDAVQDAVLAAWEKGESIGDVEGVRAMQYRTLSGKIKNYLRGLKKHTSLSLYVCGEDGSYMVDDIEDPREQIDTRGPQMDLVAQGIEGLGHMQKAVMEGFLDGKSGVQIAKNLGVTTARISAVKAEAIKTLRRRIGAEAQVA